MEGPARATASQATTDPRVQSLAVAASRGDPEALGQLYEILGRRVLGLCRRLLASQEAAEDALSEVFLKVQRAMRGETAGYNPDLNFTTWLMAVAGNHCIDLLRRRKRERLIFEAPAADHEGPTPAEVAPSGETGPLDMLAESEHREAIRAAVDSLPANLRVPLTLRYFSEMSYEEIATATGLNRAHVATLIFRAKQELRRRLRGESGRPGPVRLAEEHP